ncbi:MAG: membrane dipeptidase, partial [bacterium]|nr:membrane dipeptidase [bacterium]
TFMSRGRAAWRAPGTGTLRDVRPHLFLILVPFLLTASEPLILIDLHNDVTSATVKGLDIGPRRTAGHTDLARLREGGVGAVFFAAYVSRQYVPKQQAAHRVLEMIDTVRRDIVGRYPEDFTLALTADDIERAHREGKIAALIGIEGGHAIEDSLRLLRGCFDLGVRYMTLTHSNTNNWADSSGDIQNKRVKHHGGLTQFGREVVREMNRLGMMVDISHVSDDTFWDVLEVSRAPVIASHSSCRAISNIARNMSDEMIRALGKKGGVISINFGCEFLSQKSADNSPYFNPALKGKPGVKTPPATLADVVAHIDRAVKIAGIDAVGIGTDYDGVECTPVGLEDVSKFPNLTKALRERGYSGDDIRKIYGGNVLRLMRDTERVARTE